jgi:hypothetical protein
MPEILRLGRAAPAPLETARGAQIPLSPSTVTWHSDKDLGEAAIAAAIAATQSAPKANST